MAEFSKYPNEIDTTTELPKATDNVTPVKAEHVNRPRDAIIQIQKELGIKPSGTYSSVSDRLDVLEAGSGGGGAAIEIQDDLVTVTTAAKKINFGSRLDVVNNGDGSVTIDGYRPGINVLNNNIAVVTSATGLNFNTDFQVSSGSLVPTISLPTPSKIKVYRSTVDLSLSTTSINKTITWSATSVLVGSSKATLGSSTTLSPTVGGTFVISGNVTFQVSADAVSGIILEVLLDGTTVIHTVSDYGSVWGIGIDRSLNFCFPIDLNAGQTVSVRYRHSGSVGSSTVLIPGESKSWFSLEQVVASSGAGGSGGGGGGVSAHSALTGLSADDHTQYFLVDGTRAVTGNLTVNGNTKLGDAATDTINLTGRLNTGVNFLNTLVSPIIAQDIPSTINTTGKNLNISAQSATGTGFGGHLNLFAGSDSIVTNRANINIAGSSTGLAGGVFVYSGIGTNGNFGGELYMAAGSIESSDLNPVNGTAGGVGIYAGNRPIEGGTGNPGGIEIASGTDQSNDAVGAINIFSGNRLILSSANLNTSLLAGKGRGSVGATPGAIGGTLTIKAGDGGNAIAGISPGNGNNVTITGGNGGTGGLSNRSGGNVIVDGGTASGTGSNGDVSVGRNNTTNVFIGGTGRLTEVFGNFIVDQNVDVFGITTLRGNTLIGNDTADTVSVTARISSNLNFLRTQSSPTITQDTPTTDVAVQNLTITSQAPFASATGANRNSSILTLENPAQVTGGAPGKVRLKNGTITHDFSHDGFSSSHWVTSNPVVNIGVGNSTTGGLDISSGRLRILAGAEIMQEFNVPNGGANLITTHPAATSIMYSHNKRGGTGANAGATTTFTSQSGQDVAAGTNNNGGDLVLSSGAVGAGGTGGVNGTIHFNGGDFSYRTNLSAKRMQSRHGTTTTTGAATADVVTYSVLVPSGKNLLFKGFVTGYQTGGTEAVSYEVNAAVYNNAGTYSIIGASTTLFTAETAGATAADASIVISGTNVILRVTGVAALNFSWTGWLQANGEIS